MKETKSRAKIILTLFLLLFFCVFFKLKILLPEKQSQLDYPLLLTMVLLTFNHIQTKTYYSKVILLYLVSVLSSCLYSHFFNKQALDLLIVHSYLYWTLIFFFYLLNSKLSAHETEKILIVFGVVCSICYILQWLLYPTIIFRGAEGNHAGSLLSNYRVRIPGSMSCYAIFLYGFIKFLRMQSPKYLLLSLVGFLPIIIQGFRSLLSMTLVAMILSVPFVFKNSVKIVINSITGACVVLFVMQMPIVQSKIDDMMYRQTQGENLSNKDYVRWIELDYYWNEQFTKPYEHFFGGGPTVDGSSKYTNEIYGYAYSKGLYWDDLGVIGLSMIIGIPAVVALIVMYIICMWKCKESELQYIRFTLFTVLFGSFTTSELFREGNILLLSLFLYIEYKFHQEQKLHLVTGKKT